jgi:hypothetical protein
MVTFLNKFQNELTKYVAQKIEMPQKLIIIYYVFMATTTTSETISILVHYSFEISGKTENDK